ncbi:NAD(P)H-dependent oxidoreductase [Amycolatopsis sp. H6(2020)]|nr:NAD(P)H-dependent oxidoreductase [Amycolatopsis sp. H6(2020)]
MTGTARPPETVPEQCDKNSPLRVAVIIGSVRDSRVGPTVASWVEDQIAQYGQFETDVIDLATLPLPLVLPAWGSAPDPEAAAVLAELSGRLDAADAFIVVTPEYNQSLPASLKNAIDWTGPEWAAKPVGLVSYGGRAAGTRAAEHVRQILVALDTVSVYDVVCFPFPKEVFAEGGDPGPESFAETAKSLLRKLEWWALVLRDGRRVRPYAS